MMRLLYSRYDGCNSFMSEHFPAPVYAETVLAHNFDDAKKYFLDSLLKIHYAHTRMLAKQKILTCEEERQLISALDGLDRSRIEAARYDGTYEDLFFFIEAMLVEACGLDVAGKMHTARSRNDIAITLYRMTARCELLQTVQAIANLRDALLGLAEANLETVMPAHTHTQPAQPTTLGHYLLAVCEFLDRDAARLQASFGRVNVSPMGAAAITTSGFPIDRDETARLLGFEGLAENSYGAIGAIDYITEAAATVAVAMVNLGKFTQDLLLWSTREFGFLRLSDAYVQSSSIMPQKRNPVSLEHTRILASRALGEAQAVLTCAHNTPFGDINDSEDDLQPLVFTMFADARRALKLVTGVIKSATVDKKRLAARAGKDFLTVTELADTLVRSEGMSFREAHTMVAAAVHASGMNDDAKNIAQILKRLQPEIKLTLEQIELALDPEHFIRIRTIIGGPAPERTAEAAHRARLRQSEIESWLAAKTRLVEFAAT
jgi:argininosuccinate lyase